jgi:hypothetical protein
MIMVVCVHVRECVHVCVQVYVWYSISLLTTDHHHIHIYTNKKHYLNKLSSIKTVLNMITATNIKYSSSGKRIGSNRSSNTERDGERERKSNRDRERERMLSIYSKNIIRPTALYIFQDASVLCMPFAELGERELWRKRGEREGEGSKGRRMRGNGGREM